MIEVLSSMKLVNTSYDPEDVIMLLKDLSDKMTPLPTAEREKLIQSGTHYSELLPEEKAPTQAYMDLYHKALKDKAFNIALGIAVTSMLAMDYVKAPHEARVPVIISLARAGTPVGILMKRYIEYRYGLKCPHYSISIIRGKGIDVNAMNYIYNTEVVAGHRDIEQFIFVDGWSGKGMIKMQLVGAVNELKRLDSKWAKLSHDLFVLADPGEVTRYKGTDQDYLLPSACLNSTVSGLTSRTILNKFVDVEAGDFHGAVYFDKFKDIDVSKEFVDTISKEFEYLDGFKYNLGAETMSGMVVVKRICRDYDIADFTKVKPGIGETTRVLLRRVPWKVLISDKINMDNPDIQHIIMLCREKNVPYERYNLGYNYKVCGIIKDLSADA